MRSLIICLISGAGTGLCLLFPQAGPAVFLLPAPALFLLLPQTNSRRTFKLCAAFCLGLCMAAYAPTFSIEPDVEPRLIFWLNSAIYAAGCAVHGLLFTTALWAGLRLPCAKALRFLSVAVFWTLAEWLCSTGPFAWSTLQLSLALWQYPVLMQAARLGGHLLVSALILSVSALVAETFLQPQGRRRLLPLAGAILLLIGNVSLYVFAPSLPKADVKVAVVQPAMKAIGENRADVYEKSLELAEEAADDDPDLILLSESVAPCSLLDEEFLQSQWGEIAKRAGADLLVSGVEQHRSSIYQFGPDGRLQGTYIKRRQVPFFENGLGKSPFQWQVDNRAGVLTSGNGRVNVVICYESMFSPMTRYGAKEGAGLLAVATNDSWFDSAAAKGMHLGHGVYRAIETGRSLVQAGLDGYTAAVDARGHLTYRLPASEPGVLMAAVSFKGQDTPFLQWGCGWLLLSLAVLLVSGLWIRYTKSCENRKK